MTTEELIMESCQDDWKTPEEFDAHIHAVENLEPKMTFGPNGSHEPCYECMATGKIKDTGFDCVVCGGKGYFTK